MYQLESQSRMLQSNSLVSVHLQNWSPSILHHFSPLLALLEEHQPTPPHQLTRLLPWNTLAQLSSSPLRQPNLNRRFGYNGGLDGADTATPMLESVSTKGDETSSRTNFDMPERTTWLLHGGYLFFSLNLHDYLFQV